LDQKAVSRQLSAVSFSISLTTVKLIAEC